MRTKTFLLVSSSIELATGLALIAVPNLVANVLLSVGLTPAGEAVGRVGGFGLFSLALACWPEDEVDRPGPVRALFFYNLMAAGYLGYLSFAGEFTSHLLLPACVLHGLLGVLLARPAYRSVIDRGPVT
jgi:hypothetical protein